MLALVALLMTPGALDAQDRDRDDFRGGPSTFGDGIRSITFSPLVVRTAGERVSVEMRGRPNGTATSFDETGSARSLGFRASLPKHAEVMLLPLRQAVVR